MLIELGVHIEEVDLFDVDFIYILVNRIASSDSDEAVLVQARVRFLRDTRLIAPVLSVREQVVFHRQLALDHSELDVDGASVVGIQDAMVVWRG